MARTRTHLARRLVSLLLALLMLASLAPAALAADTPSAEATQAAQTLYDLGLFKGTGTNPDGTPIFALEKTPTRNQALIMLIRLLGKEDEALNGSWSIPFTDVSEGMTPYVGYAYTNGLTAGTTATTFGGSKTIKANQYVTFLLRALGYTSGEDFTVSKACDFSDSLGGLTYGEYTPASAFTRGDVAVLSLRALSQTLNGSASTLAEKLALTVESPAITAASLMRGYWYGSNETSDAEYDEYYYFNGSRYGCVCFCSDEDGTVFTSYEEGTFTVSGNSLTLNRTSNYLLYDELRPEYSGEKESLSYTITTFRSEQSMQMNDWLYSRNEDCREMYEYLKAKLIYKSAVLDSTKYTGLGASDFAKIRSQYPGASPNGGYVCAYRNAIGQDCALVFLFYQYGGSQHVAILHNLTTGQVITAPEEYFLEQMDKTDGMESIRYVDQAAEVLSYEAAMAEAMVSVVKGNGNPFWGVYLTSRDLGR